MKKNNYFYIALISGGSLLGGVFNYLYYPVMIQFMSIEDFGVFGSIMGLLNLTGVILTGVILFLNKEISQNIGNGNRIKFLFQHSLKILALTGVCMAIVFSILSPIFANYLQIEKLGYFILVGITLMLSFVSAGTMATLRGLKKYEFISLNQAGNPLFKLIIGATLVYLGYNIYGAIGGVVLSGIIWVLFSFLYTSWTLREFTGKGSTKELLKDFEKNKREIFQFFLVSFLFALAMNMDILIVKNIFDETSAGIYAGVSVLGKFLIFLLLSTETVYYGQIMEHERAKLPIYLLRNPFIVLSTVSLGAIVFNLLFGETILGYLKSELVAYKDVYIISLVYYGSLAYISLSTKILISWKKYRYNTILGVLLTTAIVAVYLFGKDSLYEFISILAIFGIITATIMSFFLYKEWKKI